jgi:hypothetical protein
LDLVQSLVVHRKEAGLSVSYSSCQFSQMNIVECYKEQLDACQGNSLSEEQLRMELFRIYSVDFVRFISSVFR